MDPPIERHRSLRPERFTLSLLLLALSTLFLYGVDKGYFYRPDNHDLISSLSLAVAENLSPDHNFRLFRVLRPGSGDGPAYGTYSRFPIGGYALVKLAVLPFGNDLSAKLLAARMLALLFFSAAALLAFHAVSRIIGRCWVALVATLMAFSSYYMLFYRDGVSNEYGMGLFAVMLAFHGMTVFVQEGRFRQLLAKTCVALLLGWHVYAFLLPFLILGLAREAMKAWKDGTATGLRSTAAALLRSRYTALGLAALLFGAAVLSFNFANEYAAFGGERRVAELPSFQSMLMRTGLEDLDVPFDPRWWLWFLGQQLFRVCVASVPFVLTDWGVGLLGWFPSVGLSRPELAVYVLALLTVAGTAAALVRLAAPLLAWRQRMLLAALALSGFCWALPMRQNAAGHNHDALYYVGVPLVFYSLLLLYVHERWGRRPVVALATAALLAFVVSTFRLEQRWRPDPRVAEIQRTVMAELGAVRETTRGKVVLVLPSVEPEWSRQLAQPPHVWRYYFAGSAWLDSPDVEAAVRDADFIVTHDRVESRALLTPGNERVFLYDSSGIDDLVELYRAAYRQAASGDPAARSHFDVYLGDGALTFLKEPCVREDARQWIFVDVVPEDLRRLRRRYGSGQLDFAFHKHPVSFDGKCAAVLALPDYPVSRIKARTFAWRYHRSWTVEIDL